MRDQTERLTELKVAREKTDALLAQKKGADDALEAARHAQSLREQVAAKAAFGRAESRISYPMGERKDAGYREFVLVRDQGADNLQARAMGGHGLLTGRGEQ